MVRLLATLVVLGLVGCGEGPAGPAGRIESGGFAIALHGGAGSIPRDLSEEREREYLAALERALRLGVAVLENGGTSLEAVETVIRDLEDDPQFNAGRGAVFNAVAGHELDASIMDGRDLSCGAVAGVRTVKNPISLARQVMERTPHVLLAGPGADAFARERGVEGVPQAYFHTERRRNALRRVLEKRGAAGDGGGTVGVAALDRHGDLAAGTSTGGLTGKRPGRVGDSPVIGAGTFADNRTCAISATGKGEEFIRHGVAKEISARMQHRGESLAAAASHVVHEVLRPGDGGVVGVSSSGEIAMLFNTESMFRGAADSSGRFEVAIW